MSLVRQMLAPPAGRSTADTDPLAFDLAVTPDPLRVSPSEGDPATGDLIVVASLASPVPVECRSFTVTLKVGPGGGDLCSSMTGVTGTISLAGWTGTVNAAAGTVTFAPGSGAPAQAEFRSETGVTFQVMGLPVNQRVGVSQVDISASWRPLGTTGWQEQVTRLETGKFPLGFHLRSLAAEPLSVPRGGSVTLSWDASAATALSLYYDGEPHPVTGQTSVTVPDLKQTTYFHLRAVAQDGAGSVERTLSVMVHVPDPELSVGRVIVHGTLQAQGIGPASTGAPLVFPQRLPALVDMVSDASGNTWEPLLFSRSALPAGNPAAAVAPVFDQRVELVHQPLGGAELVWSTFDAYAWVRVEAPFGPGTDPCLAYERDVLWCAYRDGGGTVQIRKAGYHAWGVPEPVPGSGTTQFRPALVHNGDRRFLAVTDSTTKAPLYWLHRFTTWTTPQRLPGAAANGAPALGVLGSVTVCVYRSGGGHQVVYDDSDPTLLAARWVAGPTLSGPTPAGPPSLVTLGSTLYCAYRDTSGHIQLHGYDGTTWTSRPPLTSRTYTHDPALMAFRGALWLV
ncbi:hypothetical protein [Streptomyces aureoverticillatus]|uniref:hypothetical protein n=1 Tax=Streptomyces aureoverticillatus TaxID=66871 RepID=UPI0013DBEC45|nr:hypothetical protein [Streptomyces aureoverticillatus]QIB47785.1 hypothetical protein G3H79_36625 [Streptomyces aureoverticillatus]